MYGCPGASKAMAADNLKSIEYSEGATIVTHQVNKRRPLRRRIRMLLIEINDWTGDCAT